MEVETIIQEGIALDGGIGQTHHFWREVLVRHFGGQTIF